MPVKIDQKMRIKLPKDVNKRLKLKKKDVLNLELKDNEIHLSKPKKFDMKSDPVITDMIERPMHSKIKVTNKLFEKWEDELWSK